MKLTETLKRRIDTFIRNLTNEEVNYLMETYFDRPKKALTIPIVVKRYRVEVISIDKKHIFDKEIEGLENASEVFQDLKIKYLDTYTSVKMTEL